MRRTGSAGRDNGGVTCLRFLSTIPTPVLRGACSGGLALLALFTQTGCAPALDWREVRGEGSELRALMPCRPSRWQRPAPWAGQSRDLQLLSCSAGESTWALAWVEGVDPARVGDVLTELRRSAARNVGSDAATLQRWPVVGETPHPQSGRVRVAGRRPDGSAIVLETSVFTRGTTVYQATALASQPSPDALDTFFGSLRLGS